MCLQIDSLYLYQDNASIVTSSLVVTIAVTCYQQNSFVRQHNTTLSMRVKEGHRSANVSVVAHIALMKKLLQVMSI